MIDFKRAEEKEALTEMLPFIVMLRGMGNIKFEVLRLCRHVWFESVLKSVVSQFCWINTCYSRGYA